MKDVKWKTVFATCMVCLVPVIFGVAMWNDLPDRIAVHFSINNKPDNYESKAFAVFGIPAIMMILQFVCCMTSDINVKKHGGNNKFEAVSKWIIPVTSVVVQSVIFGYSLGWNTDVRRVVVGLVSVIFLVTGNYLPKLNYIKNYKIDVQNARKINRFVGYEMVVMGLLGIVSLLFADIAGVIWLIMLIPFGITATVYAAMNWK